MKDPLMVMKALSDPNRVKIMKMLQNKTMCVCEIRTALVVNQPSASKHLKILENAGLVNHRKDGLWVNYYLTDGASSPDAAAVTGNLRHCLGPDPEIDGLVKERPMIRRENICNR